MSRSGITYIDIKRILNDTVFWAEYGDGGGFLIDFEFVRNRIKNQLVKNESVLDLILVMSGDDHN